MHGNANEPSACLIYGQLVPRLAASAPSPLAPSLGHKCLFLSPLNQKLFEGIFFFCKSLLALERNSPKLQAGSRLFILLEYNLLFRNNEQHDLSLWSFPALWFSPTPSSEYLTLISHSLTKLQICWNKFGIQNETGSLDSCETRYPKALMNFLFPYAPDFHILKYFLWEHENTVIIKFK